MRRFSLSLALATAFPLVARQPVVTQVADLIPGVNQVALRDMQPAGNRFFFTAAGRLWKSDGTTPGTTALTPPPTTGQEGVTSYLLSKDNWSERVAYWSDQSGRFQPWVHDPGADITFSQDLPTDVSPAQGFREVYQVRHGHIMFFAQQPATGLELWLGPTGQPAQIIDLVPGSQGCGVTEALQVNSPSSMLYFTARRSGGQLELWSTYGSLPRAFDVPSGVDCVNPHGLMQAAGKLYFFANSNQLFTARPLTRDGAEAVPLLTLPAGHSPLAGSSTELPDGSLLFAATSGPGTYLWRSDGTLAGTTQVAMIGPNAASWQSIPMVATPHGAAFLDLDGIELWHTDGTSAGTRRLTNRRAAGDSSRLVSINALGERLFYLQNRNLVCLPIDGSQSPTELLTRHGLNGWSTERLLLWRDHLYFDVYSFREGTDLWSYDLNPRLTVLGKDNIHLSDGDTTPSPLDGTHMGRVEVDSGNKTLSLLLQAEATGLSFPQQPAVEISGDHAADFRVVSQPTQTLGSIQQTTVHIQFTPRAVGSRQAEVRIFSSGSVAGYSFQIAGEGYRSGTGFSQSISFTLPSKVYLSEGQVELSAAASSGHPVAYRVLSGPGSIQGQTLSFTGAGSIRVEAIQPGNSIFRAAAPVVRTIQVLPDPATTALLGLWHVYSGTAPNVRASAGRAATLEYLVGGGYTVHPPVDAGRYTVRTHLDGKWLTSTLTIVPAPLYCIGSSHQRLRIWDNPIFSVSYEGLRNGELAEQVFTRLPQASTRATLSSPVGIYPITVAGGVTRNYQLIYVPGVLEVLSTAGSYEALLRDSNSQAAGKMEVTLTDNLKFSGRLHLFTEGQPTAFVGTANYPSDIVSPITAQLNVRSAAGRDYTLYMEWFHWGQMNAHVVFQASNVIGSSDGRRLLRAGAGQRPGPFTLALNGSGETARGDLSNVGWATGSLASTGTFSLAGRLPDHTPFTAALRPDSSGAAMYRLYLQPYAPARDETLFATQFRLDDAEHLFAPELMIWKKRGIPTDRSYRYGIAQVGSLMVRRWVPPTRSSSLASLLGTTGGLTLYHGGPHDAGLPTHGSLTANSVLPDTPAANWTLKINPANGVISGSFKVPGWSLPISGVLTQTNGSIREVGWGYYPYYDSQSQELRTGDFLLQLDP